MKKMLPGDVIAWDGHAGIYAGNNQMIEAEGEGDREKYDKWRRRYESDRHAAKRLFTLH